MMYKILFELFLIFMGIVLAVLGTKYSETYQPASFGEPRKKMTRRQSFGKMLQLFSLFTFVEAFSLGIRWLLEYYNIY